MIYGKVSTGCPMTVYGCIIPYGGRVRRIGARGAVLSKKAKEKLEVIRWHEEHGCNITKTAQRFALDRGTVRRWLKRCKEYGPSGLEDRSRKPKRVRTSTIAPAIIKEVLTIRKSHPTWSKYKIHALLSNNNITISESSVGRILKRYGKISPKISRKRQKAAKNPKQRFPRGLVIKAPGDLIQMDTKELRPFGNVRFFQFTAIDVLTKLRILEIRSSRSSQQAAYFFAKCKEEFPFPIRAVQTDNGSEFRGIFEIMLKRENTTQYYTNVRSPKQNSYVERSHETDEYEFYQQGNLYVSVSDQQPITKQWQRCYNYERPHQSLNYLTPWNYYVKYKDKKIPTKDYVVLQT